jgi:hypothetical protein
VIPGPENQLKYEVYTDKLMAPGGPKTHSSASVAPEVWEVTKNHLSRMADGILGSLV